MQSQDHRDWQAENIEIADNPERIYYVDHDPTFLSAPRIDEDLGPIFPGPKEAENLMDSCDFCVNHKNWSNADINENSNRAAYAEQMKIKDK